MTEKSVLLRLGADASGLTRGLKDGQKGLKEFESAADSVQSKLADLAATLGLGIGIAKLTAEAIEFADSVERIHDTTDLGRESIQRLGFIAGQTGGSMETLASAVSKMQRTLSDAGDDGEKARKAIAGLGLDVGVLLNMKPEEQLQQIADAIAAIPNPADQAAAAVDVFGKAGADALPQLKALAEHGAELDEQFKAIGGAVSDDAIKAVDGLGDSASATATGFKNLATELLASAAPALVSFLQTANEVVAGLRILGGGGSDALVTLDNKIVEATKKLEQMKETVSGGRWNPFASYSQDDIAKQEALVQSLEDQYNAITNLGMAGAARVKQDTEFNKLLQANAAEATAALLDGVNQESAMRDALNLKIETGEQTHQQMMEQIRADFDARLIASAQDVAIQRLAIDQQLFDDLNRTHADALSKSEMFNAQSWQSQAQTVLGSLTEMTAGIAQHSKLAFDINKGASMAAVILNTIAAVTKAWKDYGWPYGAVVGAAIAAAGVGQLNAIRSTTFNGGGGGGPPSGATTPPINTTSSGDSNGGGGGQTLHVEGITANSLLTGSMVRELADRLSDHVRDGGKVEWAQ